MTDSRTVHTHTLDGLLDEYLNRIAIAHFAAGTIALRALHLRAFLEWSAKIGVKKADDISRSVVLRYQEHLLDYRKKNGAPICTSTQQCQLTSLRAWFVWMVRERTLLNDPLIGVTFPHPDYRLPRVLGIAEIERILKGPRVHTRSGLRDRALLETLYSTGIRRTELLRLRLTDIDWHKELVSIRIGKGRKDRVIPMGERALAWVDRYIWSARRSLVTHLEVSEVFLTGSGRPFTPNHLSGLVRAYIAKALPGQSGACHTFRHSMATLMLEGGADIRFIQEMLGHSKLSSTQIYTHVSVRALKDVHSKTHPGAKLLASNREELEQTSASPR